MPVPAVIIDTDGTLPRARRDVTESDHAVQAVQAGLQRSIDESVRHSADLRVAHIRLRRGVQQLQLTSISLIPVLIFFILMQRHILEGMKGAVKG